MKQWQWKEYDRTIDMQHINVRYVPPIEQKEEKPTMLRRIVVAFILAASILFFRSLLS